MRTKHYSPKRFFRDVPPNYLELYFSGKGLLQGFDYGALAEGDVDALYTAWEALPEEARAESEQDFKEIDALACEGGIKAVIDDANGMAKKNSCWRGMEPLRSFHEKAFWIFLEHKKYWIAANAFFHADSIHTRSWRKRINLPRMAAKVDPDSIQLLERISCISFMTAKGAEKNCKVDCYKRGKLDYFFAYPEDYP